MSRPGVPPAPTGAGAGADRFIAGALLLAVAVAYRGAPGAGFVFDDDRYVYANPRVAGGLSWEGVRWALTAAHAANWHPLAWLSHQLDVSLFGLRPSGHHLVSVALHALGAALLFGLLLRMSGRRWPSAACAAIFALHPLQVESVAWVSQRKSVLSAVLMLAAALAYVRQMRRPGGARRVPVAVWFALALLAKPAVLFFPFALLLVDWWPLGRTLPAAVRGGGGGRALRGLVLEKLPLFALAAASAAVTLLVQGAGGAVVPLAAYPLAARAENAVVSVVEYLAAVVWPAGLAAYYPLDTDGPGLAPAGGSLLLVAALTALAVAAGRRRGWPITAWLWFLLPLAPVIGLVQVGMQARADRYAYLPLIGAGIGACWGADALVRAGRLRARSAGAAAALALVALAAASARQVGFWKDERALFGRALAVTEGNFVAAYNLGFVAEQEGRTEEAARLYREALRWQPSYVEARVGLGDALARLGDAAGALGEYERAAAARPGSALARGSLGVALVRAGRAAEAIPHLREAVRLDPARPEHAANLATALAEAARQAQAAARD